MRICVYLGKIEISVSSQDTFLVTNLDHVSNLYTTIGGKKFHRIIDVNRIINVWNNISFRSVSLGITFVIKWEILWNDRGYNIILCIRMFNSICWTFSKIPGEKESPKHQKYTYLNYRTNFSSTRYVFLSVRKYLRRNFENFRPN